MDENKEINTGNKKLRNIIIGINALIIVILAIVLAVSCSNKGESDNTSTTIADIYSTNAETTVNNVTSETDEATEALTATDSPETEKTTDAETKTETETEVESKNETESEAEAETEDKTEEPTGEEEDTTESVDETTIKETTKKESSTKETTINATVPTKPAKPTPAPTTASPVIKPVQSESGTPYEKHGKLTVSGTNILDKNGNIYQLKGVSTHGIQWFPQFVNIDAFKTLRDEWGVNIVRLAMYTHEGGYCNGGNKQQLRQLIDTGVQAATQLGMYVIIDWHVLNERFPSTYEKEAIAFFDEVSRTYASYGNVIYEICNEPNSGPTWSDVKAYAEKIIPIIRKNCNNIIIVGTPTWSQDVDQAAANPIMGQVNIMYALHFYAATHKDYLWNRMVNAIKAGLPIFVSEYGICDASGNGGYDISSANTWMALMDQYHVSSCIWNLANKNESSCLLTASTQKTYGWTENELSGEGKWFVNMLKGSTSGLGNTKPVETQPAPTQPAPTQPAPTQPQPTQPQPTQPQQTIAPTIQAPVHATNDNCEINVANGNGWDGHSQYDIRIKNKSSNDVAGWKLVLTFSEDISIESCWNGQMIAAGNTITISADQDWNQIISSNGEITAGVIIAHSGNAKLLSSELK